MHLKTCTITGADNNTNIDDLIRLSEKFPFVEWGILMYDRKCGVPRYPSYGWIDNLLKITERYDMNLALHLCGDYVDQFVKMDKGFCKYINNQPFKRVQLNFSYPVSKFKFIDLYKAVHGALSIQKTIITQHNSENKYIYSILENFQNYAVLFDTSGGNGILPNEWPEPFSKKMCGYAGGIAPDNVEKVLETINSLVGESQPIWIDLESGVRTNDVFDIVKVENVLSIAGKYVM